MLFDLRGSGRRRAIKVIYASLAILMGGGLVLFGIGGNVSGGLIDGISGAGGGGDVDDQLGDDESRLEKRVATNPRDAAALAELARVRFQRASVGDSFDEQTGQYNEEGLTKLRESARAWNQYLRLDPARPDDNVAALMVQVFTALQQLEDAVRAQEIVVEGRPENANLFFRLAQLAYAAGQTRKGDLAAGRAVDLTPEDRRPTVRAQLEQLKTEQPPAEQGATTTPSSP